MPSATRPPRRKRSSASSRAGSSQIPKTEITINVYDLLPPGRLSSLLWTIGGSLLHSGVVVNNREYAFGGHNVRNKTGVYYTHPRFEPPGGTWRCSILQGFSFRSESEIAGILKSVSDEFMGTSYNLLTNNCNHFTSALCEALTGRLAPSWLNRAAGIGVALPCMVPKEWVSPPDFETADGELLEGEDGDVEREDEGDERVGMLDSYKRGAGRQDTPPPRVVAVRDTSGRNMPTAERAPVPRQALGT